MEQYLGKKTCKTLKGIRRKIADANDIKYEPKECTHEGDCAGTCPACEAEVKYLERQLNLRRLAGKAVAIVGLSLGLSALTGCRLRPLGGAVANPNPPAIDTTEIQPLAGDVEADPIVKQHDMINSSDNNTQKAAEPTKKNK